jgi:DNA invertase Pin-like site-specific DNA recombinase
MFSQHRNGDCMLIGYARVSTDNQKLDAQQDALAAAGAERIFSDKASGARDDRPGLAAALSHAREGDCLVVAKLDRLGRGLRSLLDFIEVLRGRGVAFRSLGDAIDTTTTQGRLFFAIIGAFAEMERELIRERTNTGLAAARARGRKGGRPSKLAGKRLDDARALLADRNRTVGDVAKTLGVNRVTLYRALARAERQKGGAHLPIPQG